MSVIAERPGSTASAFTPIVTSVEEERSGASEGDLMVKDAQSGIKEEKDTERSHTKRLKKLIVRRRGKKQEQRKQQMDDDEKLHGSLGGNGSVERSVSTKTSCVVLFSRDRKNHSPLNDSWKAWRQQALSTPLICHTPNYHAYSFCVMLTQQPRM